MSGRLTKTYYVLLSSYEDSMYGLTYNSVLTGLIEVCCLVFTQFIDEANGGGLY